MATLSVSSVLGTGITTLNKLVLGASDTFTYVSGTGQILELNNPTGGSLTAVVKGSAPSATYAVSGAGTTVDLTAGLSVVLAAGARKSINLDTVAAYLAGTGAVTITGAATAEAVLLQTK